jgi:hypothetical protein
MCRIPATCAIASARCEEGYLPTVPRTGGHRRRASAPPLDPLQLFMGV